MRHTPDPMSLRVPQRDPDTMPLTRFIHPADLTQAECLGLVLLMEALSWLARDTCFEEHAVIVALPCTHSSTTITHN